MFDEKKAIEGWRGRLADTGALFEADVDELESHLHDHLDELREEGVTGEAAFATATARLGGAQSLADEFAKVKPLLAWRAALFWITAGVLIVLGLRPVHELSEHAVLIGAMALHLPKAAVTIAMWAVSFGSPLAFFAVLFPLARRRIDAPLPWASSAVFRVGLLVVVAVLMLSAHLLANWGWLHFYERRWDGPLLRGAYGASLQASYALAVAAPLYLGATAFRQRARAMKDRAGAAPLFWLAIGVFVGSVRCELHLFVRSAVLAFANVARLDPDQVTALMWIVTLGSPLVLFASTYAYLRHGAPRPAHVLRTPYVLVAVAATGAIAIAAVFATAPVGDYGRLSFDTFNTWLVAGIVPCCGLPVLVGTIMLRLVRAGSLALRADGSA